MLEANKATKYKINTPDIYTKLLNPTQICNLFLQCRDDTTNKYYKRKKIYIKTKCSPIWFAYVKDETPFKLQTYMRVEAGTRVILLSL